MRFRRPVVLLLGGMLVASGIGCSAASALMGDYEPASSARQASADRMLAIAQIFEQQGQLDKAETMYRGALKKNPQNAAIRERLAEVQSKRRGDGSGTAVVRTAVPKQPSRPVANAAVPVAALKAAQPVSAPSSAPESGPQATPTAVPAAEPAKVAAPPAVAAKPEAFTEQIATAVVAEKAAVPVRSVSVTQAGPVTLDALLKAADAPETSSALLIQALQQGESNEAKSLAATLLGECPAADSGVKDALEKVVADQTVAVDVLLAALDSQVQRGELTSASAERLSVVAEKGQPEEQVQAITMLRYFTAMDSRECCLRSLESCLSSASEDVRASAALTLGDFCPLSESQLAKLRDLSEKDSSQDVRDAAAATLKRAELTTEK
ncbi:MAG TPA: hypothetical protein DC058_02530 [Planctomycetaceae bacterium]|nr:hypothetical protein [Planctomycetaceae bacterium]HBC60077.1 hypothetical protein [Planctomycetaceae bacterium]